MSVSGGNAAMANSFGEDIAAKTSVGAAKVSERRQCLGKVRADLRPR
jgi:hypothetical protein